MALNTEVRKIDLNSTVDMSSFTADIHDYKGFCSSNALFLNKRLSPWYRRQKDSNELCEVSVNGTTTKFTFKANEDKFDIYSTVNGTSTNIMSISRNCYYLNAIDEYPSNMKTIVNPYEESTESLIMTSSKDTDYYHMIQASAYSEKYGCTLYFLKMIGNSTVYVYKDAKLSEHVFDIDTGKPGIFGIYYVTAEDVEKADYGIPADSIIITAYDYSDDDYNTEICLESLLDNVYSRTNFNTYVIKLVDTGGSYTNIEPSDTTYNKSETSGLTGTWANYGNSGSSYRHLAVLPMDEGLFLLDGDYVQYEYGVWTNERYSTLVKYARKYIYVLNYENDVGKWKITTQYWTTFITPIGSHDVEKELQSSEIEYDSPFPSVGACKLAIVTNFSKIYGQFAVNFVKNEPNNIAHNYKKLVALTDNMEIAGYTDSCMYFSHGDSKYEIGITTNSESEGPSIEIGGIESYFLIFNTTSYINAYYTVGKNKFCSCDDWNNRAIFVAKEYTKDYAAKISSRANNKWKTNTTYETVSSHYGSVNVYLPVDGSTVLPSDLEIFYVDSNYTCPDETSYDVYFASTMPSGTEEIPMYIQGNISKENGWTVSKDTGDTWSEDTTGQDTVALMNVSYMKFTSSFFVNENGNLYALLSNSTSSPVYYFLINTASATYAGGDKSAYQIFSINGTQYTFFSSTNVIKLSTTSTDTVCDAQNMQYIGYSSKYAYFYCTLDKHIYVFKGDATMQKLASLERYNVLNAINTNTSDDDKEETNTEFIPIVKSVNIPSCDLVILMLESRALVIYGDQACFIVTDTSGRVSSSNSGSITIGKYVYYLTNNNADVTSIPIELETEFYGDESGMTNTINNCVYLEVSNLSNSPTKGTVKIQAIGLQNGYVVEGKEKTVTLKQSDFNSVNTALIKFQPDVQECRGFKLKITSDFDISDLRIATATGSLNQSKYFS